MNFVNRSYLYASDITVLGLSFGRLYCSSRSITPNILLKILNKISSSNWAISGGNRARLWDDFAPATKIPLAAITLAMLRYRALRAFPRVMQRCERIV